MKTDDIDERLSQTLNRLDDDLQARLWALLGPDETADAASARGVRIRHRAFQKLGIAETPSLPRRSRRSWWVAGVAAVLLVTTAAVPHTVLAALQQVFSFVPGIGVVHQSPKGSPVAILPQPIASTWEGEPIQVTGVMVTPTDLMVTLSGPGMTTPAHVAFRLVDGKTVPLAGRAEGAAGLNGSAWSGIYGSVGHFDLGSPHVTGLVIIGRTRIPVSLHWAPSAHALSAIGPTQTHHGVSLTAVASRVGSRVQLTLVPDYQGNFYVFDVTPSPGVTSKPGLTIVDRLGHDYAVTPIMTVGPNNQFTFTPTPGVTRYTVTVPKIDAQYSGHARITVPVPARGSQTVDQIVNLGGFPVQITRVQRVYGGWNGTSHSGPGLRLDLRLPASRGRALADFNLVNQNWVGTLDPRTGVLRSLTVPIKPRQRSMTLTLWQPNVYIRGPWVLPIELASTEAVKPAP